MLKISMLKPQNNIFVILWRDDNVKNLQRMGQNIFVMIIREL